jgi:hypothetical protein
VILRFSGIWWGFEQFLHRIVPSSGPTSHTCIPHNKWQPCTKKYRRFNQPINISTAHVKYSKDFWHCFVYQWWWVVRNFATLMATQNVVTINITKFPDTKIKTVIGTMFLKMFYLHCWTKE